MLPQASRGRCCGRRAFISDHIIRVTEKGFRRFRRWRDRPQDQPDDAGAVTWRIEAAKATSAGRIRLGMVGGGQGAFIGGCTGSPPASTASSNWSRARSRRIRNAPRLGEGTGLDPQTAPMQALPRWPRQKPDARTGSRRFRSSRPTIMHFPAAKAFPASRHPRDLRQAADLKPGGRQEAGCDRGEIRQAVCAHAQLHRLPDGASGPRDGAGAACSGQSVWCSGIRTGLADRAAGDNRPETGLVAHRSEAIRRWRRDRRYRHPCLQSRMLRLGAGTRQLSADLDAFVDGRLSTTTPMSCCATRAAPRA
jgi:hypothetical protein